MAPGIWRPFCLIPNVLMAASGLLPLFLLPHWYRGGHVFVPLCWWNDPKMQNRYKTQITAKCVYNYCDVADCIKSSLAIWYELCKRMFAKFWMLRSCWWMHSMICIWNLKTVPHPFFILSNFQYNHTSWLRKLLIFAQIRSHGYSFWELNEV